MSEAAPGRLLIRLPGTQIGDAEFEVLQSPAVCGVILFRENYADRAQLREFCAELKSLRDPPLLISVDHEGGPVQRFHEGFTRLPPVSDLAAAGPDAALAAGAVMAAELLAVGVDLSFAPVLDHGHPKSQVLAGRTFHTETNELIRLGRAYIAGMHEAGMRAVGKHFPGHGGSAVDSHLALPEDGRPESVLAARDLRPFAELADELGGMMTAHVRYPKVAPEPATFSPVWLGRILRERIGFRGLVISDDLTMAGADEYGDPEQRTRQALDAGCDLALLCGRDWAATAAVVESVGDLTGPGAAALMPLERRLSAERLADRTRRLERVWPVD